MLCRKMGKQVLLAAGDNSIGMIDKSQTEHCPLVEMNIEKFKHVQIRYVSCGGDQMFVLLENGKLFAKGMNAVFLLRGV